MKDEKYLELLAEKYPTEQAVCREIINLKAILSLPKGTEHFMSDLHGEYEAFCHILNNCSGVIREKVDLLFGDTLSDLDREEICTLIYYPVEKLALIKKEGKNNEEWYRVILGELIEIARLFSSKYTRSKVRKAMPKEYAYILDELIHVQRDEDANQLIYHRNILDTLLELQNADEFIEVLAGLIKRLAVDHLHIVGDIFDRGPCADRIMDLLMTYHSIDIEWGNHDILWMGAAAGNRACIATVIRNNLKYDNMKILENSYGISLRNLTLFAEKIYPGIDPMKAALKEISVLLFKLEGQVILRNPDYKMEDKLLLHKVDVARQIVEVDGKEYEIKEEEFPTVNFAAENVEDVYQLTEEECVMSLFTASAVGMVIANNASLAGAQGGCQAECGSASAMAAAAIVELAGGTPDMIQSAVATALKNILGLVCDPVAGLVEIPCIKRNASGVAGAFVAAELALAGIRSAIPADEVIWTMKKVGDVMPTALKETAEGGLAATPTGRKLHQQVFGEMK